MLQLCYKKGRVAKICGICGLLNGTNTPTEVDPIVEMFVETETRGRDASGFAANYEDKLWFYKDKVKSSELVKKVKDLKIIGSKTWIGHCRLATHGSAADNANNHPFVEQGLALIHNGVIINHTEIGEELGFEYKGQCDTEGILKTINYYRIKKRKSVKNAIIEACAKLAGDMACALISPKGDMWLWKRGSNPLAVATKLGEPVLHFASTEHALKKSLAGKGWATATLDDNDGYYIRTSGRHLQVEHFTAPDCPNEDTYYYTRHYWGGYEEGGYGGMHPRYQGNGGTNSLYTAANMGKHWCMLCSSYHNTVAECSFEADETARSHFRKVSGEVGKDEQEAKEKVEEANARTAEFFGNLKDFIWIKTGNSSNERVTTALVSYDSLYVRSSDSDYFLCDDCNEDMKVYDLKNHVQDTKDHRTFWRCTVSEYLTPDLHRREYCEDCGSEDCDGVVP